MCSGSLLSLCCGHLLKSRSSGSFFLPKKKAEVPHPPESLIWPLVMSSLFLSMKSHRGCRYRISLRFSKKSLTVLYTFKIIQLAVLQAVAEMLDALYKHGRGQQ
jgi:hypothetical protein